MTGSPSWPALVSPQSDPTVTPPSGVKRNTCVHLIQVDSAVVDIRSPIGWVFGTSVYNWNEADVRWVLLTCGLMAAAQKKRERKKKKIEEGDRGHAPTVGLQWLTERPCRSLHLGFRVTLSTKWLLPASWSTTNGNL
ncbi:hypothetical protein FRB95_002037 [Tulasnella sp. JGI-2019a]|nr:hypothetical protein FRB95_002037 [Tulasnella sp. JGI-2019a]